MYSRLTLFEFDFMSNYSETFTFKTDSVKKRVSEYISKMNLHVNLNAIDTICNKQAVIGQTGL